MSHLTQEQRYTIASMKQQGYRQNQIAKTIG
ncbi:MAG: Helix-turn-helix domain, partial [Bacteroidota bacterium]